MSSRALRKLQGQGSAAAGLTNNDDNDVEDEEKGVRGARNIVGNPFNLLKSANLDSCSESEVKEDDDLCGTTTNEEPAASASKTANRDQKKKKKTKNRKRKPLTAAAVKSSEDNLEEEYEDEVEKSVKEVNRLLGEAEAEVANSGGGGSRKKKAGIRSLLSVDVKNLNPENEMKKIFGSRVVLAEQQRQPHRRGGPSRIHRHNRHWLVIPKRSWPNPGQTTGLGMTFLNTDRDGCQHFTFEHSPSYQVVQNRFYQAVESMHPDLIVEILNAHPFHVDSMLQLSDICQMGEDSQMATELVERSLYALESAFHPLFHLGTGRLDYRRQENRCLFLALFRHMVYVGSRACYRTALEMAKLIISLDPDQDPLGILLLIDFYALKSNQHRWLVELYQEWEPVKNLSQLPNFAYSVALCHFHLGRKEEADELLKSALIMFPSVLLPLLDRCSIEPDLNVATHKFFLDTSADLSGLQILTKLYVGRSFHCWKEPEILPWLEKNVQDALRIIDSKKSDNLVDECEAKRRTRYQGTPRNICRHVIISDIKDATAALPSEMTNSPILSYDPLPPLDSIDTYKPSLTSSVNGDHPFRLFFSSMLPNFNPEPTDGAAADGNTGDLRRSVTTLLDAMQDLLSGLHLPQLPNDGAASADSENDGDDD